MKSLAILAMATIFAMPHDRMNIAIRVAGEGLPDCQSYRTDGTEGPCLPTFAVERGGGINGSSLAGRITFTPAALARLNDNEFALLAGHEIAHYYLGHRTNTLASELAADRLGAELACRAGYDPIEGSTLFHHLHTSKVHPNIGVRQATVILTGCTKKSLAEWR